MRYLWILQSVHPEIRKIILDFRVFSFSGNPGTGMPLDALNELVATHVDNVQQLTSFSDKLVHKAHE